MEVVPYVQAFTNSTFPWSFDKYLVAMGLDSKLQNKMQHKKHNFTWIRIAQLNSYTLQKSLVDLTQDGRRVVPSHDELVVSDSYFPRLSSGVS